MKNKKKLYHLHIPRTSGTGILYALQNSIKTANKNNIVPPNPKMFEFVYNKENMSNWSVLSGHFAVNPIFENEDELNVFSIIRNPIEQVISTAAYMAMSNRENFTNEYFEKFLYDKTSFETHLFSSTGNIQTKMLTSRIVNVKNIFGDLVVDENAIWFLETDLPKSENELLFKITNIKIFEINSRTQINQWISKNLKDSIDIDFIPIDEEITNSSLKSMFKPSHELIKEVKHRNELDFVLYDYVMSQGGQL